MNRIHNFLNLTNYNIRFDKEINMFIDYVLVLSVVLFVFAMIDKIIKKR